MRILGVSKPSSERSFHISGSAGKKKKTSEISDKEHLMKYNFCLKLTLINSLFSCCKSLPHFATREDGTE